MVGNNEGVLKHTLHKSIWLKRSFDLAVMEALDLGTFRWVRRLVFLVFFSLFLSLVFSLMFSHIFSRNE